MFKEEVLEVLKENLADQLEEELTGTKLDTSKSIFEYGANSMDAVVIVSNTMRDLRIKVPRDELNKIKNIEELVNKMMEYKWKMAAV